MTARNMGRFFLAAFAPIIFGFATPLLAQSEDTLERFSYDGDVLARGFFLWRDIGLANPPTSSGVERDEQGYFEYFACQSNPATCRTTREREEQDFYAIRLRLNLAFRPSAYVDVLYNLEIGDVTFGRDEADRSGPGTGGRGSGRTNLETRQLLLRFHNQENTTEASAGIFLFSTPSGLVVATSGAGLRLRHEIESISSRFEGIYIRSEDNSRVDGDSNGFSDENFSDINLGILSWKWSQIRSLRSELYGVFREDDDASTGDITDSRQETSRIYWGGLQLRYALGGFELKLHGVGNWGRFHRPLSADPKLSSIAAPANSADPFQAYFSEALKPPLREEYKVNAAAGEAEIGYQVTDRTRVALVYAGASGRLPGDTEPDGSSIDYRPDQFRTTGQSFQFNELSVDDSGGYSIFSGGRLTGLQIGGIRVRFQPLAELETRVEYYHLRAYRTPNFDGNTKYTRAFRQQNPGTFLGEEWNLRLEYSFFNDLKLGARLGWFNAGSAYKVLRDTEYGDDLYEVQVTVKQTF
ncbi:MAG: hypothetical protein RIF32_20050 [Leptospirales bacterium]|jgi:hypothetical protein